MSTDIKTGHYLCKKCGNFFQTEVNLKSICPHCNEVQLTPSAWDQVIQKRNNDLIFQIEQSNESHKSLPLGEEQISNKLDIYGRKKARFRLIAICFCLFWLVTIGALFYNSIGTNEADTNAATMVEDGSISAEFFEQIQQTSYLCTNIYRNFINAKTTTEKTQFLYDTSITQYEDFITQYNFVPPKKIQRPLESSFHETFVEIRIKSQEEIHFHTVFIKKDNGWLIDYNQFANIGTMPFKEFLTKKTTEPQTFRLYFTTTKDGTERELTFIEAQPNNMNYNYQLAPRVSLNFERNHLMREEVNKLVKTWQNYKKFNKNLPLSTSSVIGKDDPYNYYRARVTLQYKETESGKVLELQTIHAAHWLGSFYDSYFTPAQKITYSKL